MAEEKFQKFPKKEWTSEDVIKYLQRRAKLLRHTPSQAEINRDKEGPKTKNIEKLFGTYNHALISAGIELPPRPWSSYSNEELLEVAREWSRKHPEGKISSFLLRNDDDLPSEAVIRKRFDGLLNYFMATGVPYEYTTPWKEGFSTKHVHNSVMYH